MKNQDSNKKQVDISNFLHKASDIGKKSVDGVKKGVETVVEQSKANSDMRRLKKLNPLFPDVYQSKEFFLPNMIVIVDDAVRRDEKLCEGAIGWTAKEGGMEVLYLYDEAVELSGLEFVPTVTCDAVYYVDSFDRKRFIRTDCIFSKAHEEKIAELKHIAYSLGAKSCSIEISETNLQVKRECASLAESIGKKGAETDISNSYKLGTQRTGRTVVEFEGSGAITVPNLKWFKHDDNIKRLIEMRCSGNNSVKSECLELSGSSSATMSSKTACSIDLAVGKINAKSKLNMEGQAENENRSKLIYCVEF